MSWCRSQHLWCCSACWVWRGWRPISCPRRNHHPQAQALPVPARDALTVDPPERPQRPQVVPRCPREPAPGLRIATHRGGGADRRRDREAIDPGRRQVKRRGQSDRGVAGRRAGLTRETFGLLRPRRLPQSARRFVTRQALTSGPVSPGLGALRMGLGEAAVQRDSTTGQGRPPSTTPRRTRKPARRLENFRDNCLSGLDLAPARLTAGINAEDHQSERDGHEQPGA
jgi:hypothetical protein